MILNRPKFLEDNLKYYKKFPKQKDLEIDFRNIPPILNLDFHSLNGILPITSSRLKYIIDSGQPPILTVNPSEIEYEYYKSIGVKEFQAISIVFNFYSLEITTKQWNNKRLEPFNKSKWIKFRIK